MYLRSLLYVVFLQLRRVSIYGYFWIFYYLFLDMESVEYHFV